MIVVIADDLSGAAELAGAALRQGLSAEVQTVFSADTTAEVLCLDTNTRLLDATAAARRVEAIARAVVAAKPAWIFKKCDSVLRGPVLAEARAVAAAAGLSRLLLVPANPSRQRVIREGHYFIAGVPLHHTAFANDPLHPRLTADVKALLGDNDASVTVPDISDDADVRHQAEEMDADSLPVGGADFFTALLSIRAPAKIVTRSSWAKRSGTLLVCGSANSWLQRATEARRTGIPTFVMPYNVPAITSALRQSECVLLGIGHGPVTHGSTSEALAVQLAEAVASVLAVCPVSRVLLEGGATAAAVIAAQGWTRLRAEQVAESGVGILRPVASQAPLLCIKPGSYAWPAAIWP